MNDYRNTLPLQIGDVVYVISGDNIHEHRITNAIIYGEVGKPIQITYQAGIFEFDILAIGNGVFMTREEAEKELKRIKGETL